MTEDFRLQRVEKSGRFWRRVVSIVYRPRSSTEVGFPERLVMGPDDTVVVSRQLGLVNS